MSTAEGAHYASSHPEVLAAWDESQTTHKDFHREMKDAQDALGRAFVYYERTREVVGLDDDGSDPPEGWQRLKTYAYLRPKRGKAGDEARELLERLSRFEPPRKILSKRAGIPDLVMAGPQMFTPGVDRFGDRVFVSFSADVETHPWRGEKNPLDDFWPRRHEFGFEQVKASTYHLAREGVAS